MAELLKFDDFNRLIEEAAYEVFLEVSVLEEKYSGGTSNKNSPSYKALKKKSDKTGFPLGILRQVYKKGYASWKLGHRPGVPPQAWAMARVNSFITGGKTTKMQDKALYQRAKKNRKKKK
jgi:hypothetical protein